MAKKILFVEDEKIVTKMVVTRLEASGYEVDTASDGETGLQKARTTKPDLVLLDIMLPKMDGDRVCAMLKRDERYNQIPILMFTAKVSAEDKRIAIEECGADDYVTKPFDPELLLRKIKKFLKE